MKPLFLVGFMGSGKSTFGIQLAKTLNWAFIDLDEYIAKQQNRSIEEIFSEEGEDEFRKIEANALRSFARVSVPHVIATGGGTPCFYDNMNWMLSRGITLYLEASEDILFQRISSDTAPRPLFKGLEPEEMRRSIAELLERRRVYYEKSGFKIREIPESLDEVIHMIKNAI